jgi:hypothetical protein
MNKYFGNSTVREEKEEDMKLEKVLSETDIELQ